MTSAQVGIFAIGNSSHVYMEFSTLEGVDGPELIRSVANLAIHQGTVDGSNMVVGIRPSLWNSASNGAAPLGLFDFKDPIVGPDGFTLPATQRDLWVWLASASPGQTLDAAFATVDALTPLAIKNEEIPGWHYRQNRDLIGFIDGSANPVLLEAPEVALVPPGSPGEYGSVLLFQRWRHDLHSFEQLSVSDQEKVIGRTKQDSEEFDAASLPSNSHVARTTLAADGEELPIFRRNTSYGTTSDNGTVFVGFSKEQSRLHTMLERMAGVHDGCRDALTYYSTPLTGSYYFVPSANALQRFS